MIRQVDIPSNRGSRLAPNNCTALAASSNNMVPEAIRQTSFTFESRVTRRVPGAVLNWRVMFSAAIFDVDGLLIDSERAIMRLWLCATAGLERPMTESDYIPTIGRAARESAAILIERLGQSAFERTYAEVQMAIQTSDPAQLFPPKPGARDILERLRAKGVPCVVASSTVSAEVRRRLQGARLLEYFEAIVGGDRVALGKPDPALYRLAANTLHTPPAKCLAFEDSDHGITAATAAAIRVVLVPDIKEPSPASRQNSLVTVASLTEAIQHLDRWFNSPG